MRVGGFWRSIEKGRFSLVRFPQEIGKLPQGLGGIMNNSFWYRGIGIMLLAILGNYAYSFQLGIEAAPASFFNTFQTPQGISYRVALISNQTGCTQDGERSVDLLLRNGMRIIYLLAPEHGFDGMTPAGKPVDNGVDRRTGIPIMSVYGRGGDGSITGKQISADIMKQVDALLYDIQDSGMRHYTYISTLLCALEAAAAHNKPIVIFDRPNYLGPNMEGPLVDPAFKSFISIAPIPLRHGMTVAELAHYFNTYVLAKPAKLHIIRMRGYTRTMNPDVLAQLSPNLPSRQSIYGYSFLGILGEIQPFDVGVGTYEPFQRLMLPDSEHIPQYEWSKLIALLKKYNIQATHHVASKNRQLYTGVKLRIPNSARVASFALLIDLIDFFKKVGVNLRFSKAFDKAMGTDLFQKSCRGDCTVLELKKQVSQQLQDFLVRARGSLLYNPSPQIK